MQNDFFKTNNTYFYLLVVFAVLLLIITTLVWYNKKLDNIHDELNALAGVVKYKGAELLIG